MKRFLIVLAGLMFFGVSFSQPKTSYLKHTVLQGETITQIAKKYQVTPYDIYKLNPEAKSSISINSILLIPVTEKQPSSVQANNSFYAYEVKTQETLYGISKQTGVSIETIEAYNPEIAKNGLQPGDVLKIPTSTNSFKVATFENKADTLFHIIKQKETPYSVSKQYGISLQELFKLNPSAQTNFKIDDKIIIRINKNVPSAVVSESQVKQADSLGYLVQPKETMFGLSQKFNCSEAELLALNPILKDGLKDGIYIKIPKSSLFIYKNKPIVDLTKTINIYKQNKELVLLVPFNLNRIEADSTIKIQDRLKKDLFLNMALDVYNGALMAIDSAKSLGINMKVKVFDADETSKSNGVEAIIQSNDFTNVGAIIGPFYPQNVQKTAELVRQMNIPVFSPLRELGYDDLNSFETVVNPAFIQEFMFDYLQKQNGNLLAAVENTKNPTYSFLSAKENISFIPNNENGNMHVDSLFKHLKPNQTNFVILDSKKTSYILSVINGLTKFVPDFDIKLVTLEKNEALNFEEINVKKLSNLNLTYPSLTHDANFDQINLFSQLFKKKYGSLPSLFAIRGFDLTLDIILRMSQNIPFDKTFEEMVSEHVYSKFDFTQKMPFNKNFGIYIQQYQDDLTIKTIIPQ
uniref:LysM peptidoglycan-binding domain-containing protein n=1 Tax=Flavobacterium sp. TaxID=239 RepID=UPI00404B34B4